MFFMLPLAASAAVAAAPAAVASASIGATITSIATNLAMNVAISSAMSALQPKVGGSGRMSDWMLDEDSPIPYPMGRVGVSGAAVYQKTFGPDLMYKGVVSVLAGAGPIDGYESYKADEEVVTFDGNGKAISSQYAGELWLKRTLGAQPDVALSSPSGLKNGSTLSGWSASHKLSGKAAAMHVMGENSKYTAFPTGEVKGLHVLRGLKGWDPRLDSTYPGGVGPCRLNNPATWVYLRRPGLWGLKWSLGLWEGPTLKGAPAHGSTTDYQVGGIGAKLSGIDVAAFVNLENICDANDWTISGYPTTDDDKHEVLKSILQAGGAVYAQRAGKISCIIRSAPRASVATITGADTAGELQLDTGASRIDRINTIRPRVISEAHSWQLTAIPKVSPAPYLAEDGGTRPRGMDYNYVSSATQGAQLAALEIANTREPMAGVLPLMPWMQKIGPGDAFDIDDPDFVLNGLKCLCLNVEFDPETKSPVVTFVSETDAKYPYALGQTSTPPTPPVLTPETNIVTPPQLGEWSLAAVDLTDGGVSVPILLFTGDVDNARTETVIFEYRPVGAADWSYAGSDDPTVTRREAAGGALTAGTQYEGAVSYRIGGRISTRLILGPVIAGTLTAGDVAPITPANVAGTPSISITSTMSPDGTITSRLWGDWADASDSETYVVELDDGSVITPIEVQQSGLADLIVRIGGTYRYRVKGRSRTGHLSAAWSNWSAATFAAGDSTAPGPVGVVGGAGNGVFPLVRQIGMAWANPTDKDLARVLIFRNSSGTGPNLTGEAPYAWSEGTRFFDGKATLGVTYFYWALTQDRTGNTNWNSLVYLGSGQARRVSVAADDVLATDPLLVTGYGIAQGFAGQGALSLKNTADWSGDITGNGKPSDNAGTSGILTPIGSYSSVVGNTVKKNAPGTHGAYQGGAVGSPQIGSCFIQSSLLEVGNGGGWVTIISLDDDVTTLDPAGTTYTAQYTANAPGAGAIYLYHDFGQLKGPVFINGLTAASRLALSYDGGMVTVLMDGVPYIQVPAAPGQKLWPKVIDYYNSGQYLGVGISDILHGKALNNTLSGVTLFAPNPGYYEFSGNAVNKVPSNPGSWDRNFYSRESFKGGCVVSARLSRPNTFIGLAETQNTGNNYAAFPYSIHRSSNGEWYVFLAGNPYSNLGTGYTDDTLWSIAYNGARVSFFAGQTEVVTSLASAPNRNFFMGGAIFQREARTPITDIQFTSGAMATVLGHTTYRGDTYAEVPQYDLRTPEGISSGFAGQKPWATLAASVNRIQYIDDSGRIVDGRGLPMNAASGAGIILDPPAPLSPGATPSTQIAVAATTVTLAGGQVINISAATISGLSADTAYAVFYDLLTSSCVAISSGYTPYFTSANRYLAMGYQQTSLSGGGYTPPPPRPPGGGGGVGNCADEDAMILMANAGGTGPGDEKRFGDLSVGDRVWTCHEDTGEWGAFEVEAISLAHEEPCCLLTLDDGRSLPVTPDHRVRIDGEGYVHAKDVRFGTLVLGPSPSRLQARTYAGLRTVVKATIRDAHTYVANGMLSHNIKQDYYLDP